MYTHQIMKRLHLKGHEVTLFSSQFEGGLRDETVDGVHIHRGGTRYSVYASAKKYYRECSERFDVIVDEINTIPFMTPSFVQRGEANVALIHQLAREFWFYELPYPFAWFGNHLLEDRWLKRYKNIKTITVSQSTQTDLYQLGFNEVHVIYNGANVKPIGMVQEKSKNPRIVFVGRMKNAKKPQDAIEAYRILKKKWPDLELFMVGDGNIREEMQRSNRDVHFLGYVSQEIKDKLVMESWAIAVPGVREGWGQVVTDANALGTPAVGYNVHGLKDSIKNGYNGLLVEPDPSNLSEGLDQVLSNAGLRAVLSNNSLEWASRFSWDKSADEFEKVLREA